MTVENPRELVGRILARDSSAADEFARRYYDHLASWARSFANAAASVLSRTGAAFHLDFPHEALLFLLWGTRKTGSGYRDREDGSPLAGFRGTTFEELDAFVGRCATNYYNDLYALLMRSPALVVSDPSTPSRDRPNEGQNVDRNDEASAAFGNDRSRDTGEAKRIDWRRCGTCLQEVIASLDPLAREYVSAVEDILEDEEDAKPTEIARRLGINRSNVDRTNRRGVRVGRRPATERAIVDALVERCPNCELTQDVRRMAETELVDDDD